MRSYRSPSKAVLTPAQRREREKEIENIMATYNFIGFDLSIKRLAAVGLLPTFQDPVVTFSTLTGPKTNNLTEVIEFFQSRVIPELAHQGPAVVAMDWNTAEFTFGGRPNLHSNVKTFIAGYLYRSFLDLKCVPIFFSPRMVRSSLGLSQKTHKLVVQSTFLTKFPEYLPFADEHNEHEIDALILARLIKDLFPTVSRNRLQYPFQGVLDK